MSKRKQIFAAFDRGEYAGTGWDSYGTRKSAMVRQIKRLEADERNAATLPKRRRAARR